MLVVHPDLHAVAQRCFEREQTSDTREAHARTVRRRMEYHLLPQLRMQKSSGDEILHNLNKSLDRFGYVRSKVQRQLHNAFLNAVAPFIYGDELQLSSDRILAENNWSDFRLQTLALTPRRFGTARRARAPTHAHARGRRENHGGLNVLCGVLSLRAGHGDCRVQYGSQGVADVAGTGA